MKILHEPVAVRCIIFSFWPDAAIRDRPLGNREGERKGTAVEISAAWLPLHTASAGLGKI